MARHPRFCLPGHPQHIIQRGNNGDNIFINDDDYRFYLDTLGYASRRYGCAVHAYVLMKNHVHLLLTPASEQAIGRTMQSLGRRYVQHFNISYWRTGTLWEGRYRATLVDAEHYLLICYRYIELNPVRAGWVERPADYAWSSFHYNALGAADGLISEHPLYSALGGDPEARRAAYRGLFRQQLSATTLTRIREATNKAWVLGNRRFRDRIETLLERQAAPRPRGGDHRSKKTV